MHLLFPTLLFLLRHALAAKPKPPTQPTCTVPASSSSLPSLTDCQHLITTIFDISTLQNNDPILWTAIKPPPDEPSRFRLLPYTFRYPLAINDCEIEVDVINKEAPVGSQYDTFPSNTVAEQAEWVVRICLAGSKLGSWDVGPKMALKVTLRKRNGDIVGGDKGKGSGVTGNATLVLVTPVVNASEQAGD